MRAYSYKRGGISPLVPWARFCSNFHISIEIPYDVAGTFVQRDIHQSLMGSPTAKPDASKPRLMGLRCPTFTYVHALNEGRYPRYHPKVM